jgi:phenylacetate-coenzyme A ligase PaaK-like adenylate-forming protein
MLNYVFHKSDFYKELFHKTGITPDGIKSMDDLVKIPFTEPDDLRNIPYRFVCVPLGKFAGEYLFDTSGTSGLPKRVACTRQDIDRMVDFMSAGMRTVSPGGRVIMLILPAGRPNSQADLLSKGVRKMGGSPIIGDINASPEEHIKTIEKHHPEVIFTSPSRIHRITMGCKPRNRLSDLGVKTLFLTSEYLSGTMREKLQDIWNCDVFTHYGMTEMGIGVAVECHAHNGFHFNEADLLLEIVDPDTGAAIEDDREGELVFTTLTREGTPLIRYRTHDIARVIRQPCPCGASTLKGIGGLVRKTESLVAIGREDEIHPAYFDDVFYSVPEVIDYQVVVDNYENKDCLKFVVEVIEEGEGIREEIKKILLGTPAIGSNLELGLLAEPEIELVSAGALLRYTRAKKLIVDNR